MFSDDPILARLQREQLDILIKIDELCRKHNITYFLMSGSLLGAARHRGFIPWDDDIDIAVPRADFERLEQLSQQDFPPSLFFQTEKLDRDYHLLFGKVRKKGTHIDDPIWGNMGKGSGIYIDIFPLDQASDKPFLQKKSIQYIAGLDYMLRLRYAVCKVEKRSFKQRILSLITPLFPTGALHKLQKIGISVSSRLGSGKFLCSLGGIYGYPKEVFLTEDLFPPKELTFEGRQFFVPNNWERILRDLYGEYELLPPEQERKPKNDMNSIRFE